jgi:hypothetical protein
MFSSCDRLGKRVLEPSSIEARPRPPTSPVITVLFLPLDYNSPHPHFRIAAKLAPEDPEVAFNLASVLEAC